MAMYIITALILLLSVYCAGKMIYCLKQQPKTPISISDYFKLTGTGILAFIADTLGVGSFAVSIALAKLLKTFKDEELPAAVNGAQIIPGTLESLFFMQLIEVDLTTLITLVAGTCIGGLLGGNIVSRLSKQGIRLAMMCCFSLIIILLICQQLHILPSGGDVIALHSWKLIAAFFALIICGALTSVGIGLFAMVQGVLFLLGVSPAVAFPIMTTAGAMQQPLTTLVFLKQNKIPLKKTLIISAAGCVGVMLVLPIFKLLTVTWLHSLLLLILMYNLFAIGRTYLRSRPAVRMEEMSA